MPPDAQVSCCTSELLTRLAVRFGAGLEAEASRLGCRTALSWSVAGAPDDSPAEGGDSIGVVVRLVLGKPGSFPAAASSTPTSTAASMAGPFGDCARKVLTLMCGENGRETLQVEEYGQGRESGVAVKGVGWSEVRGKFWWDRLRRIVLLW